MDPITIQLPRDDAAALIYVLDSAINDAAGEASIDLAVLRQLQTELIGAFGGTRPPRPA